MIFRQWKQVLGLRQPPKTQTRRVGFPYELAVQLWKRGWTYPRSHRYRDTYEHPWYVPWDEWQERHPISDEHIVEANRILAEHTVTLPVQPGRGKKSEGRIRVKTIRRERLGDISEADCLAEGLIPSGEEDLPAYKCPVCGTGWYAPAFMVYSCLWNCCGGNWERDRLEQVWVLEFGTGPGQLIGGSSEAVLGDHARPREEGEDE